MQKCKSAVFVFNCLKWCLKRWPCTSAKQQECDCSWQDIFEKLQCRTNGYWNIKIYMNLSSCNLICYSHITFNIRRPLVGHQAVKDSVVTTFLATMLNFQLSACYRSIPSKLAAWQLAVFVYCILQQTVWLLLAHRISHFTFPWTRPLDFKGFCSQPARPQNHLDNLL